MRPANLPTAAALGTGKPHGVRIRYMSGCHCMLCRAANSRYETERALARKAGDWNGIVPADRARKHLRSLSRQGIGRRLVSEISGSATSTIQAIKAGRKTCIRARTERAILAVDREARSGGTLVPAEPTWKRIDELIEEGFIETELAGRLGYKCRKLQFARHQVTARTEQKVMRFYASIMEGA